jgi:hypothetical protein
MIEEFSFGNCWSFKESQTLNMSAAKIKSHNHLLDLDNIISVDENTNLLKSKAIYGANASGKSNITKALVAFLQIVKNSVKEKDILSQIEHFRFSTETANEPTFFQLIFRVDKIRYRYGFEADKKSIKSEWLFSTPNIREQPLFIRENNEIVEINQKHFEDGNKLFALMGDVKENPIFRENSLFLSSLASFGFGKISQKIIQKLSSIAVVSGLGHYGMYNLASDSLDDIEKKRFILNFLKDADVGINDLKTMEFNDEDEKDVKGLKWIFSYHSLFNEKQEKVGTTGLSFQYHESEGTIKMFELSSYIYNSLKEGKTLIIDEFDARFHPLLTKKIVELYNSVENKEAQLIFTTHDTNLLSSNLLRRDQIDFVEKDKFGASHLYTLVEIKGIRNNASFEKDYIQGKYGAIPFLGNFSNLLNSE